MSAQTATGPIVPWWREPTRDQWQAWIAAWLGWTLDAFDFTIFLLIMLPISREFHVPLTAVAIVFTLTFWMRFVGAVAAGWLADRIGRKTPLMISIAWFSACNLIAGFSPTFLFLAFFRTLLGIGMGAEWPVGAALAMETWPQRSRGFMAGVLQGSWGLGGLMSAGAYGLFYNSIGWRGLLMLGVLPALAIIYVRKYVKEPPIWLENRRQQRLLKKEVRAPLLRMFRRDMIGNTLLACWWMASGFIVAYSIGALFATHLERDLGLSPGLVALPIMLQSLVFFFAACAWGRFSDRFGRRWAMILPAIVAMPLAPLYLLTHDYTVIVIFFALQGAFGAGGMYGQNASYLAERFPTETRATASGFCYHQGAIFGGLAGPVITYLAATWGTGLAIPMLVGTLAGCISFILALLVSPETRGRSMESDLAMVPAVGSN
ncbi:MAG TPA: MFS transporter [Acetobacteraceae bacterium]|nr:MFS transporter [Acetobacteraceae bacterium]